MKKLVMLKLQEDRFYQLQEDNKSSKVKYFILLWETAGKTKNPE